MCVCDEALAKELEAIFVEDIKGSEAITLEKWRGRPFLAKTIQGVVSLLQEQV